MGHLETPLSDIIDLQDFDNPRDNQQVFDELRGKSYMPPDDAQALRDVEQPTPPHLTDIENGYKLHNKYIKKSEIKIENSNFDYDFYF